MSIIEVKELTKKYKDNTAVDKISFSVEKGEIFGFLGPNGAGKTTTISVLTTLLKPTAGLALVNDFDVLKEKDKVRSSIGIIFQDPSLDDKLTARENLRFHAWLYKVPADKMAKRIDEMLKMVGLEDKQKKLIETYSGGMKRRLEIARGLLHYPQVLFLDEPTIGLDPQTRAHIWDYIMKLRQQENITMFMTTHYMDEAEYCDRIAIMDNGKIIALDTPKKLKKMVGGDVIILKTEDNEKAKQEIMEKFQTEVNAKNGELMITKENGEEFIPQLFKQLSVSVASISNRKPTLNDVFLKLTGKEIREEEASTRDKAKKQMKMRGGGH
ncbi:ATP-binding cassette domain-containing protein [Patescibacteria group bacterium]|nr:ATP-binding cassette domain-containing protein [Patescibacteria group bacterium]MBU1951302.1 ATP-binding cassette domain-containing protein [Patescibacteria group bacterium]